MAPTRRDVLAGALAAGAARRVPRAWFDEPVAPPGAWQPGVARRADFEIAPGYTYINGAYTHPMPRVASTAQAAWATRRGTVGGPPPPPRVDPRPLYAALINARPDEIAYIPNTSAGENWVTEALGLPRRGGNVVTDALHFEGALVHLAELAKQGLDVRTAPVRDGRILLADLEQRIDRHTRLVEVSLVSMYNGFQHDLKAVCDLSHAHGAYVYADLTQAVGAVPVDVKATGVDFAATSSYKWLMGDFGLGFLYVRHDLLGRVVQRPHWSYESAPDTDLHLSPFDPQYPRSVTYTPGSAAAHHVQLGTYAIGVGEALSASIPYLQQLGVANIEAHRQPLLARLQTELRTLGWTPQTPRDSRSPIVTFALKDTAAVGAKLTAAKVNVRVAPTWIRMSPSVYNEMADVERLLEAVR
ncbi:MAG: aminotransferase class V-fold PLP-dependent enzyme [Gemmatimonadaceae bacterium]|nr:aminotransferase class V-fold PLP-dependent enzyme [Gemmatimonadaceae bacterium]